MKTPKDKSVKNLKRLINTYGALGSAKKGMNKKLKDGFVAKPYEPLFNDKEEIKIAITKLILLGEDVNET